MKVKRANESWTYIYVVLGFALSIEGTIIQMFDPIKFPWNVLLYFAVDATSARRLVQHCPGRQCGYLGHEQICPAG